MNEQSNKGNLSNENHRFRATQMLEDIDLYLDDEDQIPSVALRKKVELLLEGLYQSINLPVDVEATAEGDIMVTAHNEKRNALIMYCDANGPVVCRSNLPVRQVSERYKSIESVLSSKFVLDALNLLRSQTD